ncbi:MAG TPA: glycerol-3-phosphate acyltransferase [Dehalococcoidia bacterium]|nr:glycerol-3-phosphate acyltransferase [Dehalococcoidia bacterium]
MIVNEVLTGIIAIIIAYLLGSIPFAYIFTRLMTGRDIRQLGSGNVGGNNVYGQVGLKAAIPVAIFDVGKGTAAVAIAHWLLDVPMYEPQIFVLLSGIAAVAGHMWSIYLKFTGGNGLSATIGVLAFLLPWELLIVIALLLVLTAITRNLVLSVNISLLSVPISAWFLETEWMYLGFCLVLIVMLVLNFIPTAKAALVKAGTGKNLVNDLLRKDKR